MTVEMFRRRPTTVETMLWDGTAERAKVIREWVGVIPDDVHLWAALITAGQTARIWNSQEKAWFPCPIGHRVVKGKLGEFYAVSPDAIAETYEPVGGED